MERSPSPMYIRTCFKKISCFYMPGWILDLFSVQKKFHEHCYIWQGFSPGHTSLEDINMAPLEVINYSFLFSHRFSITGINNFQKSFTWNFFLLINIWICHIRYQMATIIYFLPYSSDLWEALLWRPLLPKNLSFIYLSIYFINIFWVLTMSRNFLLSVTLNKTEFSAYMLLIFSRKR